MSHEHRGSGPHRVGQVKEVTSLANPIIKDIKALSDKKTREQSGTFMAEGLKLVRIGGGEERATKLFRHFAGRAIAIEPALVEMTDLDRVKTIDVLLQSFPADRAANDIKRMRCKSEQRGAPRRAQSADIVKVP